MSVWPVCAVALGVGALVCGLACLRADRFRAVIGLEVAGVVAALDLLVLSVHYKRQPFADLGLVLAVLSFAGALAFLRYLERD
jgi:multisubunit Na+/H+ antiporter MnhF subunit